MSKDPLALQARLYEELLPGRGHTSFILKRGQSLRIDPRAQALVALLRHSLRSGSIEPLEAESLALTLVCRRRCCRSASMPSTARRMRSSPAT